jgi:hypothetical protein
LKTYSSLAPFSIFGKEISPVDFAGLISTVLGANRDGDPADVFWCLLTFSVAMIAEEHPTPACARMGHPVL